VTVAPALAGGATPLRVLLVEDDPDDATMVLHELRKAGFAPEALRVENRAGLERALAEFAPELVVSDYKLPAFDGRAALELVRQRRPDVPVILVSGALGDEAAAELVRLGARDFVLKDRPARLGPAARAALSHATESRQLHAEETRYRVLIENVADVIAMIDAGGVIRFVSPSVRAAAGYAPEELVGRAFADFAHPDEAAAARAAWRDMAARPGAQTWAERRYRRKDGAWRYFEVTSNNLLHLPGVEAIVAVLHDVTARKESERVLTERAAEQERFLRLSVGRELRMVELKREVNALARQAGRPVPYPEVGHE